MWAKRGWIGIGALLLAATALYVLFDREKGEGREPMTELSEPALDDIDAKSRDQLRDLLREAGNEDE